MSFTAIIPNSWGASALVAVLTAMLVGLLVASRSKVAGTTLQSVWWWTLAMVLAIGGSETYLLAQGDAALPWVQSWRFALGVATFCPAMAVLGARRPTEPAWVFVVLTLWGVLALPAFERLLLQPNQPLEVRDARSWFLLLLVITCGLIYLPTRMWPSSLLQTIAQAGWLWGYFPGRSASEAGPPLPWLVLGAAGIALAVWRAPSPKSEIQTFSQGWLEFRDTFGALWSLRVIDQFNRSAAQNDWPVRLTWSGLISADPTEALGEISADAARPIHQAMQNLLRRFLSTERIGALAQAKLN